MYFYFSDVVPLENGICVYSQPLWLTLHFCWTVLFQRVQAEYTRLLGVFNRAN